LFKLPFSFKIKPVREARKGLRGVLYSMRLSQWTKNLAVFAAIIFNGKLFDSRFFWPTVLALLAFSFVSSASYLVNDLIDAPYDRLHPQKRNRPIARGDVSPKEAITASLALGILGLVTASFASPGLVLLLVIFFSLHMVYSFFLKKTAILDILGISFSFIIRALSGEVVTGYHLPVWLIFAVVFLSLFVASGKRRSELVKEGVKARPALVKYQESLLDFYNSVFAVSTLISYSLFTYLAEPPDFSHPRIRNFLIKNMPKLIGRKWLMITIFPVIFGIMRYSQLVLERSQGQRPEKLLASDIPLLMTVVVWGLMLIAIIYVL